MKNQYFSMPTPAEMQALIEFCKVMASSPFYQKLGPGGVMAIYLTAKEYDLPFMACMNGGLHTFDGKVTFSAIMIDSLIIKAGHKTDLLHLDEKKCVIRFTRGDRRNDKTYQPLVYEYTIEQAAKAGYLKKNNWQTSPKDMLYSRCLTGGGRKHTPEVFVGVLVAGELVGDDSDANIAPLLPPNVAESTNLLPDSANLGEKTAPVLQISHEKSVGFDEFMQRHGMVEGSRKLEFVTSICESTKKSQIHIVNCALANEKKFLETYDKWEKDNAKKKKEEVSPETPRSMDEVAEQM
jgi:hypothetical protein